MIVELDRDPALYADGNIVEVSSFCILLLLALIVRSSGPALPDLKTLLWMASRSEERGIRLRRLGS
jgi:hypothetical protein